MARIHFLDHYRYNRFVRTIKDVGYFPSCPNHQLSVHNVLDHFSQLWKGEQSFDDILHAWDAVSLFVTFHFQQPVQQQLEMYAPFDYSRFVNHFVPIFKPKAKTDYDFSLELFDRLGEFLEFLFDTGRLDTLDPFNAARLLIFKRGRIHAISRRRLRGPEWAVVHMSPIHAERVVFTFNDVWLLVAGKELFENDISALGRFFNSPDGETVDALKKRAHLARLTAVLRRSGLSADVVIKGFKGINMRKQALEWLTKRPYVSSLLPPY